MKKLLIFGANSGIAESLARKAAGKNCHLFLVGRDANRLEVLANDLKIRGALQVDSFVSDLSSLEKLPQLVEEIFLLDAEIDSVLLAHGVLGHQLEDEVSAETVLERMQINFLSPIVLLTELSRRLKNGATLAVISSVAGDRGRRSNYVYGSAKAGLIAFLEGLRGRLRSQGICVLDIRPGFVDTAMTKDIKKGFLWASSDKVASDIFYAMENRQMVLYTPWFWKFIMLVVKSLPRRIFMFFFQSK